MSKDANSPSSLGSLLANSARAGAMSEPVTDRPWQSLISKEKHHHGSPLNDALDIDGSNCDSNLPNSNPKGDGQCQ